MTRSTMVLAATLILSLGCMGATEEAPVTTPTVTTTPDTPDAVVADPNATCCCEYTEDGATDATFSVMTKSSCESWSYTCVEETQCEAGGEDEAEVEAEAEAEAEAEVEPTPKKSTGATAAGARTGSSSSGTTRVGGGSTRVGGGSTRVGGSSATKARPSGSGGMGGKPVKR